MSPDVLSGNAMELIRINLEVQAKFLDYPFKIRWYCDEGFSLRLLVTISVWLNPPKNTCFAPKNLTLSLPLSY